MFSLTHIKPHQRVQIHMIKTHGASNLNRDDLGRPKEMHYGGTNRLRISSQSLKNSLRHGEVFESFRRYTHEQYGTEQMVRTSRIYRLLVQALLPRGLTEKQAHEAASAVISSMSRKAHSETEKEQDDEHVESKKSAESTAEITSQVLAISRKEIEILGDVFAACNDRSKTGWAQKLLAKSPESKSRKLRQLRGDFSPEIQLFGRMITSDIFSDISCPLQMAHAFTVHEALTERDYWTCSEDIKDQAHESSSAMIDVRRFGSGVFYHYLCLDADLLMSNLKDSHESLDSESIQGLCRDTISALIMACALNGPKANQTSFASHSVADFMLIEVGESFPLSAAGAFESSIEASKSGHCKPAIDRIENWYDFRKETYGASTVGEMLKLDKSMPLESLAHEASKLATRQVGSK